MTSFRTIAGDPTKVVYNCYLSHQRPCHLQLSIASVKASVACECGKWQMARTWPVDVACVWPVYMWPVYVTAMCRARLQYYVGTCSDSHCSVTGASVVVITPCVYTYHTKSQHSKCATPIQTCIFSCVCPFFLIAHNLVLALQIIIMS